jgi:hypothetical protein
MISLKWAGRVESQADEDEDGLAGAVMTFMIELQLIFVIIIN